MFFLLLSVLACTGEIRLDSKTPSTPDSGDGGDADGDGFAADDCDDADPDVYPGATEDTADGVDQDCDGVAQRDRDEDGYIDVATAGDDCDDLDPQAHPGAEEDLSDDTDQDCDGTAPHDFDGDGHVDVATGGDDCDDLDPTVHPGATEDLSDAVDQDCDGVAPRDQDGDGSLAGPEGDDCDDLDSDIRPGAEEVCNGVDDDCDGATDTDAADAQAWHADEDGDGWGSGSVVVFACEPVDGYTLVPSDCDDADADVRPGATELCDGVDNDCDGVTDPADAADAVTVYTDADADGYGDSASETSGCDVVGAPVGGDCDDTNGEVHPLAEERCDATDRDCDGDPEAGATDADQWYRDEDEDGYGDAAAALVACEPGSGWVLVATDCDDGDSRAHPSATEVCDGVDDDCDGRIDVDAVDASWWYVDGDRDGFGDPTSARADCEAGTGEVGDGTDCDDGDATAWPGGHEVCDGVDNDCDGGVDVGAADASSWYADGDGDGHAGTLTTGCDEPSGAPASGTDCDDTAPSVHPGAVEQCNDVDDDCDARIDDDAADADAWYADADADGFGDAASATFACAAAPGWVSSSTDCDDGNPAVSPAGTEICDGVDDDCDGTIDDAATDAAWWYLDADEDGYGDATAGRLDCAALDDEVAEPTDCDDGDSETSPVGIEVCDDADNDCDGRVDSDAVDAPTYYYDADGDDWPGTPVVQCDAPLGGAGSVEDCDDTDASVSPGAAERCDGKDQDCDSEVDEDAVDATTFYADADSDGYGTIQTTATGCSAPTGYTAALLDCDDADGTTIAAPRGTGHPRIYSQWLTTSEGDPCFVAGYEGVADGGVLTEMAASWGLTGEEVSDWLHELNPEIQLALTTGLWTYEIGEPADPTGAAHWSDSWLLRDTDGNPITVWSGQVGVLDITDEDARDFWESWVYGFVAATGRPGGTSEIYDTIFVTGTDFEPDYFLTDEAGAPRLVDRDDNGVEDDEDELREDWVSGSRDMLERITGLGLPVIADGDPTAGSEIVGTDLIDLQSDGAYLERAFENDDQQYAFTTIGMARGFEALSGAPPLLQMYANDDATMETDYARMRYGLCLALLSGSSYSYDFGVTLHGYPWWYDEYDGGGQGPGYLGEPLGDPEPFDSSAWGTERIGNGDFETSTSGWSTWTDTTTGYSYGVSTTRSTESATGTGSLAVTLSGGSRRSDWDNVVYTNGMTLTGGATYRVHFAVMATQARVIEPYLQKDTTWELTAGPFVIAVPGEWLSVDVPIVAPIDTTNGRLGIAIGNTPGTLYIDDVSVRETDTTHVWVREFEHGLVLVNLGDIEDTLSLGSTWRHIAGTQDPTVNDGTTVTTVTIPAKDGLILLR